MSHLFAFILNAGVTRKTRPEIAVCLRISASINILLTCAAFVFTIIFAVIGSELAIVTIMAAVVFIFSMALQMLGFRVLARVLTSFFGGSVALTLYGLALDQTGGLQPKLFATCAFLATAPWFLFAVSERVITILTFLANIVAMFLIPELAVGFSSSVDASALNDPLLQNATLVIGFALISTSILSMQKTHTDEKKQVEQLLQKVEAEKKASEEQERKLQDALEHVKSATRQEEERLWATRGVADVSRILRDEDESMKISDKLISFIVKYLKCNQGALFELEPESPGDLFFVLKSCYAYERKKFLEKKIAVGQGLIGQCFYEKDVVHIKQIPKDYIKITSGLGLATPRSILIVPVMANDEVLGAIELASFNDFEKHQIEFMKEIAETIAVAFKNIKNNEETKRLLTETQELSEQMRWQEEAMRQNMEELTAIQAEQTRVEEELRKELAIKEREIEMLSEKLFSGVSG